MLLDSGDTWAETMTTEPDRPTSELPSGERASMVLLVVTAFSACAADLATKAWAHARLAGFDHQRSGLKSVQVIPNHLDFVFAQNPGGAWSLLRGVSDGIRRPFFLFISAAAVVFIVSIYRKVPKDHVAMQWGLSLALGGALGNLADRIRYGWVIDFIDVYIARGGREIHWPTFNVADIAIVAGVFLMGADMIGSSRRVQAGQNDRGSGGAPPSPLPTEEPPAAPPAA
jgi:signal peptidase II